MIRWRLLWAGLGAFFATSVAAADQELQAFVREYCVECHGGAEPVAQLDLESLPFSFDHHANRVWENVVGRLRLRQMPPPDADRPDEAKYRSIQTKIETALDAHWKGHLRLVNPPSVRRLNRTEYQNAIRDLLAVDIDAKTLLPADEPSHGFDNVTVTQLTPALLARYLTAAQRISRLAVGTLSDQPEGATFRVPADLTQDTHIAGLPLGTRGGILIPYPFPAAGEYEIQVRLARDRNEEIEGLRGRHQLDVLIDEARVHQFTLAPPKDKNYQTVDENLTVRVEVEAGVHDVGVTFVKQPSSLLETKRQPYEAHFNMHRHPRLGPAVFQVSIVGPLGSTEAHERGAVDTPGRQRLFGEVVFPKGEGIDDKREDRDLAKSVLSPLIRRAYRRSITDDDLIVPLALYDRTREEGGSFDTAIEAAVCAVLVNPHFLLRIERVPADVARGQIFRISDFELASRLSFFLWSSLPDDELLDVAERGELHNPDVLERQVRRMLVDPKSQNLVTNFADQWLYLRNLSSITPDLRLFPDFDENLRDAFRRESMLFVQSVFGEDRSVLDLLRADYTFLNERLARHYDIPHVYGSHFRRVALAPQSRRGGLLRQGSILTVTSYATRTSPVIRGHWILKNLMGAAPPPPPANVPTLPEVTVAGGLTVRERLAEHRAHAACAICHDVMDPVGFALENYDAVGRWRDHEDGTAIDSSGGLPDGSVCEGVSGLEAGLLERMPEVFVSTLAERLLTFALGRGVDLDDRPAVREIVRAARGDDFRFSSLVLAMTRSVPFQMRMSHDRDEESD